MASAKPIHSKFPLFQYVLPLIIGVLVNIHVLGPQKGYEKYCMYRCYGNGNISTVNSERDGNICDISPPFNTTFIIALFFLGTCY